ncbi:MAG: DUF4234 domain-containing protein [Ruminococcaceae bacterium]|nr:DUF4234 domain-containing protein [Oscillospiraceae bacterium]
MVTISKKRISVSMLLSIVTFGIYTLYWQYLLVYNTQSIKYDEKNCIDKMACFVFVPFYSLYWWYTRGELIKKEFIAHNYSYWSSGILYVILSILGLNIIAMAFMQSDFNSLPSGKCLDQQNIKTVYKDINIQPILSEFR